ncbi:heme biosynthesis protein HemY [Ahniella affigens]|nr:heme biosynthesis HemY N-terminal domain-containing protein [Ahniella affigens]
MRLYRNLLSLLAVGLLVAIAVVFLQRDPGYVLVQRGPWVVETTAVSAVFSLGFAAFLIWLLVVLIRAPFLFFIKRRRRSAQKSLLDALRLLASGAPEAAEKAALRASQMRSLKSAALILGHAAAHRRQDSARETEMLNRLAQSPETETLALELRARQDLRESRAGAAIEVLNRLLVDDRLSAFGARTLMEAYAARHRTREGLHLLPRVRASKQMADADMDAFEARMLARTVRETADAISLHSLWTDLPLAQKRLSDVATAYAHRAVQLNLVPQAAQELESCLKHEWSQAVVRAYGLLPPDAKLPPRLKTAEAWLESHADDPELLLALGRLCRQEKQWIKAEDYLRRALHAEASASIWEEIGRCYAEQGDAERAATALGNALSVHHGDLMQPLIGRHCGVDLMTPLTVAEERDAMGIPRLPGRAGA